MKPGSERESGCGFASECGHLWPPLRIRTLNGNRRHRAGVGSADQARTAAGHDADDQGRRAMMERVRPGAMWARCGDRTYWPCDKLESRINATDDDEQYDPCRQGPSGHLLGTFSHPTSFVG